MSRFLVTTADERSWKFDRSVLFLGEWCRLYNRKHVWEGMDAVVAEPYGLQSRNLESDLAYIEALSSRLLTELVDALNAFHGTHHTLRYWRIVLGHWLLRYVTVVFNRYFTLEQALENHAVSGTAIFNSADYSLATDDSVSFIWATNDDVWNHVLCGKILDFLGGVEMEMDVASLRGVRGFKQQESPGAARGGGVKRSILNAVNRALPKFSRRRDAFIVNSYFPLKEEIRLQLSLGQCPQLWRSPALQKVAPDPATRRNLNIGAGNSTDFERFVRGQLGATIPTCYVEGYAHLVRQVKTLPWPSDPRFIFTSNRFDFDELFKVWTASKTETGTPYFTGQHGSNYGTHVCYGNSSWPERSSADKFITWGWNDASKNNAPAFMWKLAGRKSRRFDRNGGVLLLGYPVPHRLYPHDNYYEYTLYQEEQFRFVESLPADIQQQLTVRLHTAYKRMTWSDEQRWRDRSPCTRIETGVAPIQKLIAQSRLVVHSCDSTGMIETLALNIPTMCFWPGGLNHLLPGAKPYYQLLRAAGILLDTPEQAAERVSLSWGRVGEWWESPNTQHAREVFCQQYARTDATPVLSMKKLLTKMELGHSGRHLSSE